MKPHTWTLPALDLAAIETLVAGRAFSSDSRKLNAGDVFIAFKGEYVDGRDYIAQAIAAGASAVIWDAEDFAWRPEWSVPNLAVPQLRAQAGIVAAHLHGNPSQFMRVIGITGTNGKTSIAHWLTQAFTLLGQQSAVLGTMGNGVWGEITDSSHTTLDPLSLQQWLAQFKAADVSTVAMEVSSHGLAQARAHGVAFDVAVFTNLTRDHLDYHHDMASYGAEKAKLFQWEGLKSAVINVDDEFGRQLADQCAAPQVLTYGLNTGDIRALWVKTSLDGIELEIDTPFGRCRVHSSMIGGFNASNLLAALGALLASGVPLSDAAEVLQKIEPAAGRMQRLGGGDQPLVIVDYAHTPDALEKALITLRASMDGGKLFCVFGCGGDRDPGKRPLMARIACDQADNVVITSDNPRTEDPARIVDQIVAGLGGVPGTGDDHYTVSIDRKTAIGDAIAVAEAGDVVLIAGKGHETYQEINGVRHHFDDVEEARAALQRKQQA
ncbi:UDP-N-acetylmuramoyl-L-alanyl-D-glutamate--2,6-diaminopimelate ligase [Amantichitinum ursilacus]|uniref:UDP-N-acetylmuramoyl-L-alanyl-D-glutamate--2,6-diaminopimelate ligase n=1 Tax=Amantichitinum ursilacus TaxID=857265 RepID=A0A0N0GN06_9NEIS|nr:UDP-N-acetylmuramoyl-L-alanyl-D-glutamate--2,6-diaminopimelate ligase [Amantichitinum ursilacus]KPC52219.1 UDP-N-acetylmuramoyl-L-alanyl-D-glutamate--2,6-diaminopimelate ligase [Amantichitinum ursilacus]